MSDNSMKNVVRAILVTWRFLFPYLIMVAIWALSENFVPAYLIPGPITVFQEMLNMLQEDETLKQIYASLFHIFCGVGLTIFLGTLMGLVFGFVKRIGLYFEAVLPFFQSVPGISWSFLALIWFGLSNQSVIFVIFVSTFASMIFNVMEGSKNVDTTLIKMGTSFGYRGLRLLTTIYLPAILPFILSGTRVVLGLGWKVAVIAEMLVGNLGLGSQLYTAAYALKTETVLAGSLIIVLLTIIIEYGVLRLLERRMMKWRQS